MHAACSFVLHLCNHCVNRLFGYFGRLFSICPTLPVSINLLIYYYGPTYDVHCSAVRHITTAKQCDFDVQSGLFRSLKCELANDDFA